MADTKTPVILDTDIGGDIDDTWALGMMLKCPELDVKMVVTDTADTVYRAKIVAKVLEIAGRTDVPVAVGIRQKSDGARERQAKWVGEYDLASYPGTVHEDGVRALVDALTSAPDPVTLVCIGPVPNVARALELEPGIAPRTHFVGMHGSIDKGHMNSDKPIAEWNVRADPASCRAVFEAPWKSMTITPLDTCGRVKLTGEDYLAVLNGGDDVTRAVIDNYRVWSEGHDRIDPGTHSSTLFDTVAVHLAFSREFLKMEEAGVRVTDEGFTVRDEAARRMQVAIDWTDLDAYHAYLARRMTAPTVAR